MGIYRIVIFYFCCNLIFAQSELQEPIFQWKHFTGARNALIQKLSLQWLENRKETQGMEIYSIKTQPYSISFREEILIRRYKSDDFVTVDYDITITGATEELIFTVTKLNIYLHEIMRDDTVKKHEIFECSPSNYDGLISDGSRVPIRCSRP